MNSANKEEILAVIRGYQQVAEDTSELASISDIREDLMEDGEKPSRGQIVAKLEEMQTEDKTVRRVSGDSEGQKQRFSTVDFESMPLEMKRRIEETRKELRDRICRQPLIEEIAEEMGREPSDEFRVLVRQAVSDEWRKPDEDKIQDAKSVVQKRVEQATELFLWGEEEEEKIKNAISDEAIEYYEANEDLFHQFDYEVIDRGINDVPRKLKVKVPTKLGKYMEEDTFYVTLPTDFHEEDEKQEDYAMQMTEKIRKILNS